MDSEKIAFEIISSAGDCFSDIMLALDANRSNDFVQARKILQAAQEKLTVAHQTHSQLLFNFAQGKKIIPDILLVHAQDHLTKSEVMLKVVEELIFLNEKVVSKK